MEKIAVEEILNLLKQEPNEVDINYVKSRIENYYLNNARHSYAKISRFIYEECDEGDYEYITENLSNVINHMEGEQFEYLDKVIKLMDHIELESQREFHIKDFYINHTQRMMREQRQRQLTSITSQRNELKKEISDAKEELHKEFGVQKDEIDKLNGNIVSVLGIFGAIIVAFFGGLSFLGGVLNNMHNVSAYRLTFIGIVFLLGLFNIIFLLFFCISKIVKKELWSSCNECEDCKECNKNIKKNRFKCTWNKYPLVISYNIIALILLISTFILYVLDKYNICAIIINTLGLNSTNGIAIVTTAALLYCIMAGITFLIILTVTQKYGNYSDNSNDDNNDFGHNNDIPA